ncbi:Methyltransferase-like protein 17, mitochondrial [Frankliniella fusca]|uniref:Methyltransferase-like protein 17, mitochondrial n=1 Tax=Frankliniella fusca TaxID=407009 RepID=A0AAE1HH62_9NEOP|nr:Methyltransferase-like protein 17, mitochondrial [Frankliniella fusca]
MSIMKGPPRLCFLPGLGSLRKCTSQAKAPQPQESKSSKRVQCLDLDPQVKVAVDTKLFHPRKHPGIMRKKVDEIPNALSHAMEVLTEGRKKSDLSKAADSLRNQLWGRLLPPEKKDYTEKIKVERMKVLQAVQDSKLELDHETYEKVEEKVVTRRLKDIIHPWHPLGVSAETCLQYLLSRTPAEYCILHKVLSEIHMKDPTFHPNTLFDFGSGVASGYWAAKEVWQKSLKEVYNVDSNVEMNELACKILKLAKEPFSAESGIFFRQFLPVSTDRTYDLVISAFSLLELPSFKDRMDIVSQLWLKTEKYLVLIEDGTNAGYEAIMEARNLVSHLETPDKEDEIAEFHVFSPCPHDFLCPRMINDRTPCNFIISYRTPKFLEGKQHEKKHMYSYVVLKKAARPLSDPQWPRCVRGTLLRPEAVHLQICQSDGTLNNVMLQKKYNSRNAYRCAKRTLWGDCLPGNIVEQEVDK